MINHPNIGGVCGYMGLKLEKNDENNASVVYNLGSTTNFILKFVDIQRAQQL